MLNKESSRIVLLLYEALLCIYIIIAPINNALNDRGIYAMVGYSAMLLLSLGTLCGWLGGGFNADKKLGGIFTGAYLIIAFTALGTLTRLINYRGATQLLMYAQFISLSRRINLKKILVAFYISSIVSAVFSVSLGWVSSSVSRTAAMIDGSVAPTVLAITLFVKENFENGKTYKTLKAAAFCCAVIVAFFGMSRSRILIIGIMLALKFILSMREASSTGRVNQAALIMIPVAIILVVVALSMDVTKQLLDAISDRYESGFEDLVRKMEREAGWKMFKQNWLAGRGWNQLLYKMPIGYRIYNNHNMYVTILARGGIVLGITMFYSFILVIRRALEKKNTLALVLVATFFALGYGNAGVFNYTICSMMIPVAILLDQEEPQPELEEETQ